MKTKSIKQTVTFKASPAEIYDLLMNAKKHSQFTGGTVKMSDKPNGKFVVFDGYCHGKNLELKPGKLIKQEWHFREEGWPEDHYSVCEFQFEKTPSGTKLKFTQTGIPEHKVNALKDGWKTYYWNPMKTWIEEKKSK